MRDIYIGGLNDANDRNVWRYYNRQRERHPGRDIRYYQHWEVDRIRDAMNSTPRGQPLNLGPHSMGAAAAIRLAREAGREITNLLTIDPVDFPTNTIRAFPRPDRIRNWVNVTASPDEWDRSDWIAWAGGPVDRRVTDMADRRVTSGAHHYQFGDMMDEIDADRLFDASYRQRQPRRRP